MAVESVSGIKTASGCIVGNSARATPFQINLLSLEPVSEQREWWPGTLPAAYPMHINIQVSFWPSHSTPSTLAPLPFPSARAIMGSHWPTPSPQLPGSS